MASITSLTGTSSSTSSIYGTRNVISGLASGLDTETLIENAVTGYKTKITSLQQSRTKVEWQQEAYRSIISKLSNFSTNYASYTSSTNLLSASFFDKAVQTTSNGENASKVSASGKTTSTVQVNSVTQLATAARYSVGSGNLKPSNVAGQSFNVNGTTTVGVLSGSLTLGYGGTTVQLSFDTGDVFESAQDMADAINKKLEEQTISFSGGSQAKASERIRAVADEDTISFELVKADDGNSVWINSASDGVKSALGISPDPDGKTVKSFTFNAAAVTEEKDMVQYLSEAGFSIVLDGVSKTIKGPTAAELGENWSEADYLNALQKKIDDAFGAGKLTVSDADSETAGITLQFTATDDTSAFQVTTSAGKVLGMEGGLTSYVNTSQKLGDLLTVDNATWDSWRIEVADSDVQKATNADYYVDADGNRVKQDEADGKWYRVNSADEYLYGFEVNGEIAATVTKDSTLAELFSAINGSSDITAAYSQFTGKFTFTAKDTGAAGSVSFGENGLAAALFGSQDDSTYTQGQDAIFNVTVNGETRDVTRSSNTIDIDGMSLTLKGTFTEDTEAVTFTTTADADKIIGVIKQMVEDYNAMVTEIKKAYSTMPEQKTDGTYYEPLTDEDKAGMSESTIASYEEKAKAGLLFGDRDLSNLYNALLKAVSSAGLEEIGITLSYSDGLTTLTLNENDLRTALADDPDKVRDVFTRSIDNGDSSNGLIQALKTPLDAYGKTTGTKGILVDKAGSTLAPTSLYTNELYQKLCDLDEQIADWQEKMSDQIDSYTEKFTYMEQLIAQMNNQSSMLSGLMGGY